MGSFIGEFWSFLRVRKKFWLAPMMITIALFGALLNPGLGDRTVHLHTVLTESRSL